MLEKIKEKETIVIENSLKKMNEEENNSNKIESESIKIRLNSENNSDDIITFKFTDEISEENNQQSIQTKLIFNDKKIEKPIENESNIKMKKVEESKPKLNKPRIEVKNRKSNLNNSRNEKNDSNIPPPTLQHEQKTFDLANAISKYFQARRTKEKR